MSERTVIAFVAVTGSPTIEDINKIMQGYKNVNINDVLVYPRVGLEAEYMSEEWRSIFSTFLDFAVKNDMRVWLYDEMNWPSGTCNGQVHYENDEYYGKKIYIENGEAKVYQYGFKFDKSEWPFANCNNSLTAYRKAHEDRFFKREIDINSGKVIKEYSYDEYNDFDKSGNKIKSSGVNLLEVDAIKCFIRLTHQRYYDWFGEYFGTVIPGIFTDEPSYRHAINNNDERTQYNYYTGICDDYKNEFGTDFVEDMLAYEYHKPDNNFKSNYTYLVGKQFKKSFMDSIYDWCQEHNLMFTGHMVHDDDVTESALYNGNLLKILEGFHLPGIDDVYTTLSYKRDFLGLSSSNGSTTDLLYSQLETMRRNGKEGATVELYALGPYNISVAQRARQVYYSAAFGITHYFVTLGHMTAKGNFLRGEWFSNTTYANVDFEGMRDFANLALDAQKFANKTAKATVSVRYPYTAVNENIGSENIVDYDLLLKRVIELLGKNQYQWCLIDTDEISNTEITVSFSKNGIIEESTGNFYRTADAWFAAINGKLTRNITVTEMSGVLADDVFVKEFTDGSYMIINRSDNVGTARDVIVNVNNEKRIVRLLDYGVYTGEEQIKVNNYKQIIAENVRVDLNGNSRFHRCNFFENHSYTFVTDKDIEVKFHICVYPEKLQVRLDKDTLEYSEKETGLTDCYNPLYEVSKPILLEKGKHVLSIPEFDKPFLPRIIMEGNITCYKKNGVDVLTSFPNYINPEKKTPFFNTASLHFDFCVPENGANVLLDDFLGLCKFKINGELVSQKSYAPYVFEVGKKFAGETVHCEVEFYSSYQALYGEIEELDNVYNFRSDWVKEVPISSRNETVGMNGLRIFAI